jgi:release factor glutamine methyltransferase
MTFYCRPNVLIPRPETEELVENIVNDLKSTRSEREPFRILDIGSGSGCIGISLSATFPSSEVIAIDPNSIAVSLSEDNARKNIPRNNYRCINTDFKTFVNDFGMYKNYFDLIVSNPPYIPSRLIQSLQAEVRDYEDRGALDGGDDGLDIARSIIYQSQTLLKSEGPKLVWLEVSREHPDLLEKQLSSQTDLYEKVTSVNDLSNHPRFIRIQYK